MNDETALVTLPANEIEKYSPSALDAAMGGNLFLPYLVLITSSSNFFKNKTFKQLDHYAIVRNQNPEDCGESLDVVVLAWRPKAVQFGDTIISCYDPMVDPITKKATGEFKRIQDKSFEFDSGCQFGVEFLIWVPEKSSFVTFFLGGKSSRKEVPMMMSRIGKAATLKSKVIQTEKYTWSTNVILPCTSVTAEMLPEEGEMNEQIAKFNNPPKVSVEKIQEEPIGSDSGRAI